MKIEPRPGQPRINFDEESLAELADSITEHGIIQPITVRKLDDDYYQIIAGERRWRAARIAGLQDVPVNVINVSDEEAAQLALVENLQREDLNPIEEARGYKSLMETYGMTQEQAAKTVGKSRPVIANSLRLLKLPEDVLGLIEIGTLTLSHARAILELENQEDQSEAARITVERDLSVRETTALVKRIASGNNKKDENEHPLAPDGVDYYAEVEKDLSHSLGRKVKISAGAKKGHFQIEYYSKEDFEVLYNALMKIKALHVKEGEN
jgi:ParB family chromosome partitioning protein